MAVGERIFFFLFFPEKKKNLNILAKSRRYKSKQKKKKSERLFNPNEDSNLFFIYSDEKLIRGNRFLSALVPSNIASIFSLKGFSFQRLFSLSQFLILLKKKKCKLNILGFLFSRKFVRQSSKKINKYVKKIIINDRKIAPYTRFSRR